jgi:hypothetical protein
MYAARYRPVKPATSPLLDTAQKYVTFEDDHDDVALSTALISLQSRPDIRGLIDFARKYSPYYGSLYSNIPMNVSSLQDYPIIDLDSYWKANECKNSQVLTMPLSGGIVWKTGGQKNSSQKPTCSRVTDKLPFNVQEPSAIPK